MTNILQKQRGQLFTANSAQLPATDTVTAGGGKSFMMSTA